MKAIQILFGAAIAWGAMFVSGEANILYSNSGDNTTGFVTQYGNLSFSSDGTDIIGASGGGYVTLPITVNGDFQMSFDVYGDSNDVDSDILFLNPCTSAGIEIRNCPQNTDTPILSLEASTHFSDYQGFYWDHTILAQKPSTHFPLQTWVHVTITKVGNTLVDNVGGQVLITDLTSLNLQGSLSVGLGYYATTNLGGAGQIGYSHIFIRTVPPFFHLPAHETQDSSSDDHGGD